MVTVTTGSGRVMTCSVNRVGSQAPIHATAAIPNHNVAGSVVLRRVRDLPAVPVQQLAFAHGFRIS